MHSKFLKERGKILKHILPPAPDSILTSSEIDVTSNASSSLSSSSSSSLDSDTDIDILGMRTALDRLHYFRQMLERDLSGLSDLTIDDRVKADCQICLDHTYVNETKCCRLNVCNECMNFYIKSKLAQTNSIHVECLNTNCTKLVSHYEITQRMDVYDKSALKKYQKMATNASLLRESNCKACPGCSRPHKLKDRNVFERIKNKNEYKKGNYPKYYLLIKQ